MNKKIVNNFDGTYNVTIFSSDNKKKLILPPTAYEQLLQRLRTGAIFCYLETRPDMKRRYTLDKFHTNYPDDTAARILSLDARHDGGIIHEVRATIKLVSNAKGKCVEKQLEKCLASYELNIRAICGPVVNPNKTHRLIQTITGIYFVPVSEKEEQEEVEVATA